MEKERYNEGVGGKGEEGYRRIVGRESMASEIELTTTGWTLSDSIGKLAGWLVGDSPPPLS